MQIKLSDGITHIGNSAFRGCSNLASVIIPNGVKKIGIAAFEDFIGLTSVTIPNSVKEIGERGFVNCQQLCDCDVPNGTDLHASAETHTRVSYGPFGGTPLDSRYRSRYKVVRNWTY